MQRAKHHSRRLHSLDALRASALLLGILLHAAAGEIPNGTAQWDVEDGILRPAFGQFIFVVHSFRLELFFLLAGFFARGSFRRMGARDFLRNRFFRIFVPFVAGWFLIYPLTYFAWTWGTQGGSLPALVDSLGTSLRGTRRTLALALNGTAPLPLTHLWFLYYLSLLYVSCLVLRAVVVRFVDPTVAGRWFADRVVRFLVRSHTGLPLLAVATAAVFSAIHEVGMPTPDKTLRPHLAALVLYGGFFVLGWFLHRQPILLVALRRRWAFALAGAVVSTALALALAEPKPEPSAQDLHVPLPLFRLVYATMMWTWVFGLLGLFLRFLERESGIWQYLAQASYWVYILHLPVVMTFHVLLAQTDFNPWQKFFLSAAGALVVCTLTYQFLVRTTFLGVLLNGKRLPFSPFRTAPPQPAHPQRASNRVVAARE